MLPPELLYWHILFEITMAPLTWPDVMKLNLNELDVDPGEFAQQLINFEADSKDPQQWNHLFQVCKKTLEGQSDVISEIEQLLLKNDKVEGKTLGQKDQEIFNLNTEIKKLKRENNDLKTAGGVKNLQDELDKLVVDNRLLEQNLQDKVKRMSKEERENEAHVGKINGLVLENNNLKEEVDQLQNEVKDGQRLIEALRDNIVQQSNRDEFQSVLDKKNKVLNTVIEENRNLTQGNMEMEKRIIELHRELQEGRSEMERTTHDYLKLKVVVDKSDENLEEDKRKIELLQGQINDMEDHKKMQSNLENNIMVEVERKISECEKALKERDEVIRSLEQDVFVLNGRLASANIDADKASIAMLRKAVEERDGKIKELSERLEEAISEINSNAIIIEEVKTEMQKGTHGSSEAHTKKYIQLRATHQITESKLADAENRMMTAERHAKETEKALNEANIRNEKYERGVYGLTDAVNDVKKCNQEAIVKNKQIEELTRHINHVEMEMGEIVEENEELREKLNLKPREILQIGQKGQRMLKDRALNRILQREIETLEQERLNLKMEIRKLAPNTAQRATALGLTAEDMEKVSEYMENLKRNEETTGKEIVENVRLREKQSREQALTDQVKQMGRVTEQQRVELKTCTALVHDLKKENSQLVEGLRQLKDSMLSSDTQIECPILGQVIAAMDMRSAIGQEGSVLALKSQLDNLAGRNEELRNELKLCQKKAQNEAVEAAKELREALRQEKAWKLVDLPVGMSPSSQNIIASLNDHVIHLLHEISQKKERVSELEKLQEEWKTSFSVLRHKQGLMYSEHVKLKEKEEEGRAKNSEKLQTLQEKLNEETTYRVEYNNMLDSLEQDENELRRRLGEMTRKTTLLKINEKVLSRRFTGMRDMEEETRRKNFKLNREVIEMESCVAERMSYLQREKDLASYKLSSLHRSLEQSVPAAQLKNVTGQLEDVTEKYREQLESSNQQVLLSERHNAAKAEIEALRQQNDATRKELEICKEKSNTLESVFQKLREDGQLSDGSLVEDDVLATSRQLTLVQMKELNERQRADHADRMYQKQREQLRALEDRNIELETKFAEVTKLNLQAQQTERHLRDHLATAIPQEVSNADRERIRQLEETEAHNNYEISQLKDMAAVASNQAQTMDSQLTMRDKEVSSLRQQLLDFQSATDEQALIGRLHRHIVRLQMSEGTAVQKLQEMNSKLNRQEALLLRTMHQLDRRETALQHKQAEHQSQTRHLRRTIQDLRIKFAGSVPLHQQERFSESMTKLQKDKQEMEQRLAETRRLQTNAEQRQEELAIQNESMKELMVTLKEGKGAEKVAEWQGRMDELRLKLSRTNRSYETLSLEAKHHGEVIRKQEEQLKKMEEMYINVSKDLEEHQLTWQAREVSLEREVQRLESQQFEIAAVASKFEVAAGVLPDDALPVGAQLDQAITTIKANVKLIVDSRNEVSALGKRVLDLQEELKAQRKELTSRDLIINELRLRLPATEDRERILERATRNGRTNIAMADVNDWQAAVRVAQSSVQGMQSRLDQKEALIEQYEGLLHQAQDSLRMATQHHAEEMAELQNSLYENNRTNLRELRSRPAHQREGSSCGVPSNRQLRKLNELEDIVSEQEASLASLQLKLQEARSEAFAWRNKYNSALVVGEKRATEGLVRLEQKQQDQLGSLQGQQETNQETILELTERLRKQEEANKQTPNVTMRREVERLRKDLVQKEQQEAALSQALLDLKGEMSKQAEKIAMINVHEQADEKNLQRKVDSKIQPLLEQLDEREKTIGRLRVELKELTNENEELMRRNARLDEEMKDIEIEKKEFQDEAKAENERLRGRLQREHSLKSKAEKKSEERLEGRKGEERVKLQEIDEAERPYEETVGGAQAIAMWTENKKWQKSIQKLKGQIAQKEVQVNNLQTENQSLKVSVERLKKDKALLESRVKLKPDKATRVTDYPDHKLQSENFELKERIVHLENKLGLAEAKLAREESVAGSGSELLKLNEKNLELKFEIEQLRRDVPRLKDRVQDLQNYISVLKTANDGGLSDRSSVSSNIRRIGESGKSTRELEKTIALLKKAAERLQRENQTLRANAAAPEQILLLKKENQLLSKKLEDLTEKAGAGIFQQRLINEKGTNKLMNEHEKLRKQIIEQQEKEKEYQATVARLEKKVESQSRQMSGLSTQLDMQEVRQSSHDIHNWKAVNTTTRGYEQQLNVKEEKIGELRRQLEDVKERELKCMKKMHEYESKETLGGSSDLTKQEASQLKAENKDLQQQVERLCSAGNISASERRERARLHQQNIKLKKELASYGPDFFEEIEDLKYNYQQSTLRNSKLEEYIKTLAVQFGFSPNLQSI